jgi:hypothetical protein
VTERSREMVAVVESRYRELAAAPTFKCSEAPARPAGRAGIYLLSETGEPLHVGRTGDLRKRLLSHRRRAHGTAPLRSCWLGRRPACCVLRTSPRAPARTRSRTMRYEVFGAAFKRARTRIGDMDVQTVDEGDPVRQALLEIYAAVVLGAKYNSFENH